MSSDEQNRVTLACRSLLVREACRNVLCEAGIGAFFEPKLRERYGVQEDRHVLLVDDVLTTGTTVNECAKALRMAGAESISALTLARTIDTSLVADRVLAASHARSFPQPRG